jgi:hypothetical protein
MVGRIPGRCGMVTPPTPRAPKIWSSERSPGKAMWHRVLVLGAVLLAVVGGVAGAWWWLTAPDSQTPRGEEARPSIGELPRIERLEHESNGEPVSIPVLDATQVEVARQPAHGSATVRGTAVVYVPAASHIGPDTLSARACNDAGCADLAVSIRTGRPGLSALRSVETRGVVRRADQPLTPGTRISGTLPDNAVAVAVSVTVHDAERAGAVTIDAGGGRVDAVRAAASGETTSNVVVVPVARRELTVIHRAGGGLTVDIVGTFTEARQARGGRFVKVSDTRVAELDTARDGRNATISPATYGARPGIRAALVLVTAEIGSRTAWVDFGRSPGRIDRTMTWGPGGSGPERRSVALVPVNRRGEFSLNYQNGSRISVDVLGYFTGNRDASAVAGLYVPRKPTTIFDETAKRSGTTVRAPAPASAVFVSMRGAGTVQGDLDAHDVGISANRTIGTVLPAERSRVAIRAAQPLQVRIALLGYFVR